VATLLLPTAPLVPLGRFSPPSFPAVEPLQPALPPPSDRYEPIPSADWLLTPTPSTPDLPLDSASELELDAPIAAIPTGEAPRPSPAQSLPEEAPSDVEDARDLVGEGEPIAELAAVPAAESQTGATPVVPPFLEPEPFEAHAPILPERAEP